MATIETRAREAQRALADLPQPEAAALAQSHALVELIASEIGEESISFARYMALALYAPGLGYYSGGARKFGEAGDFTTAPEISALFSRALARQCAEVLGSLGGGDILEFGAGSGVMASDILLELEQLGQLPQRYLIQELSGELRERQRETIQAKAPHLLERVEWLDGLDGVELRGVVLGNELLDAMPVERFRIAEHGVEQVRVTVAEGGLVLTTEPAEVSLRGAVERLQSQLEEPLPVGYESECCLEFSPWFSALSEVLKAGVALLIDYGYPRREYYLPQRSSGTLICHYRHRAHEAPLYLPGLQDITSFVDFSAATEAALDAGFELGGYTNQMHLLIGCGLEELLAEFDINDTQRFMSATQQIKKLTMPGEMGERFKALALTRDYKQPLRGFSLRDYSGQLEL
ncbi:hypothetical protein BOW53_15285 [Solemya pervernicosa gill symbiont]|uniref:SAM-dependent methyltransferase n=2 Tax=Gammaproteobacteria incertae sedis TaxID=118884 RepID=A0A1T2L0C1_9GAMM|nr:SAM-dependent methyltransferase [Candidatus Reidiella endopervernicosa]OOZ38521.1 hypothetical protein BOW53_15285 [Solemya pervernicosa gill symbiont]QKQ24964.1 SAM-dependent methyltransferase [Candidatus Reidiella endopervernicosa]